MWKWFNCYLSGRHEFGVWCEAGEIFLRCMHCGHRTSGWAVHAAHAPAASAPRVAPPVPAATKTAPRVITFPRAAAR